MTVRRQLSLLAYHALPGELVVDNFAGGGGASTGIEAALGRPVDIAINHDPKAIAMHAANHPETRHFCESIWEVDPREACGSRPVGLAWFSPACTHFSRARGAHNPKSAEIRGLAWVVLRWAATVRPRVVVLENVEEFQTWGPLDADGQPDKLRAGETFDSWVRQFVALGYSLEFRSLVAADYGTPTTRKRLFLVARRDESGIRWPDATHGKGRPRAWRPAADIIDWTLPCPSIFTRPRPLADKTVARIAAGIERYVVGAAQPYIVDGAAHTLVQTGYGERKGQAPRALDLGAPLRTVVAGGAKHGLVAAFLAKHYGGVVGQPMRRALGTVTAKDHHALVTTLLAKHAPGTRPVVTIDGESYAIADIGMRMLQPHELFAAQGFPASYVIAPEYQGKPLTKTAQIALAGNSVCPQVAEAIVARNTRERVEVAA